MLSLGEPPERISENGTECLMKSVLRHSYFQISGFADAAPVHTKIKIATADKIFITAQGCAAYAGPGKSFHRDETLRFMR